MNKVKADTGNNSPTVQSHIHTVTVCLDSSRFTRRTCMCEQTSALFALDFTLVLIPGESHV